VATAALPAATADNRAVVAVRAEVFSAAGLSPTAALPAVALPTKTLWASMQADMAARLERSRSTQKILKQQVQRL
jgi:hypothetical protein